jgi:alpha-L-rhamnosidase
MEWSGKWIRGGWATPHCPWMKTGFGIEKEVRSATLQVTALGVCEAWINGQRVGDTHLLPGWTDYRKRVYYHSFEVGELLRNGENRLGAVLGLGWYAGFFGPFQHKGYYGNDSWFSCVLEICFEDGSSQTVCSDETWTWQNGPLLEADLLMGETYDARLEIDGWCDPECDGGEAHPVYVVNGETRLPERIEPYPGVPVRTITELPAQSVAEPQPGVYVFDLAQNMVGVVQLKVDVPAGTEIILKHGEMLNDDGTVYTENLRYAKATDRYIAKGGGEETWTPRFTFHGFRYVQIEGLPEDRGRRAEVGGQRSEDRKQEMQLPDTRLPTLDTVTGVVWMSNVKETASFECSDPKVNRLFENIRWGFRGNYLEVPTDCPQRDERLGWTGDTQMFIRSASYLADIRPFFKKWLVDLHDAQHPDGGYPDIAPFMGTLNHGLAAWSDAGIICPYVLWQQYNDLSFVRPWWKQMKAFMTSICKEGNRHNDQTEPTWGDWLNIDSPTPNRLIGLAYRAYDARLMQEMAEAMGETADTAFFAEEARQSRACFRDELFDGEAVVVKTQTAAALAIVMELVEGDDLEAVKQALVECVEQNKGYLTTGFIGTGYLCPALSKAGRGDLAVQLLLNEDYPSWLYEVNNGATTIWERWNSWTADDGFGDVGMNSFNHYAFGSVCEWMLESLAGIKPGDPGFQTLEVAPCLTDRFDYVKASFESIQGPVSIHWKAVGAGFVVELETPVPATVRLPCLTERVEPGCHVFKVLPDDEETGLLSPTEAALLTA